MLAGKVQIHLTIFVTGCSSSVGSVLCMTLGSETFFRGDFFPLLQIQEEQVVSYCQKNGP